MFSCEVETLLEKANNIISELICTLLLEDFGDKFTVIYNKLYEELRIEEMGKEKIDREAKE
jgi:flagellin-specific chaperone FliS